MAEDSIEPAISCADESLMKRFRWIPDSEQISTVEPICRGYCIFYWDLNGDPNMVEIDSFWTKDIDAIRRMKYLFELERKTVEEGFHVEISINDDDRIRRFPEEYSVRWLKNDGTIDPTRGIFCRKVPVNDVELLNVEHLKELDEKRI